MSVLVFADSSNGHLVKSAFEAVAYGKNIADKKGTTVTVVTYGDSSDLNELGNYGATKVLVNKNITCDDSQQLSKLVCKAVEDEGSEIIIFSHDVNGKAIAPRVSARLDAGLVTGAVELPEMNGSFVVKKAVFSGKAFAHTSINTDKKIISLLPNSIRPQAVGGTAEIVDYNVEVGEGRITVKEIKGPNEGEISLPDA